MDNQDIQRLRDLPIESVAERLGLTVTRHKTLCPFHPDRHPSLSFHRGHNTYRCFVCGAHGGTIDLTMQVLDKSFPDACRWLANEHNIIYVNSRTIYDNLRSKSSGDFEPSRYGRFFEHPFISNEAAHFLYDERHLDPRVIRWCRLNSYTDRHGIHWLQIPYYDINGHLIGVQLRNLDYNHLEQCHPTSPEGTAYNRVVREGYQLETPTQSERCKCDTCSYPRFRFPTGSRCSIYNLQILKMLRPQEPLYIAEGCSDCWSLLSAGHKAIAIPSATLLTEKTLEPLKLIEPFNPSLHMYPDRDPPGERLFLQLQEIFPAIIRHDLPPDCKDFSDLYLKEKINGPINDK